MTRRRKRITVKTLVKRIEMVLFYLISKIMWVVFVWARADEYEFILYFKVTEKEKRGISPNWNLNRTMSIDHYGLVQMVVYFSRPFRHCINKLMIF